MKSKVVAITVGFLVSNIALAYESSDYFKISSIRSLDSIIYFETTQIAMCSTSAFSIDLSKPGANEMYATLLSAAMSGKAVKLETWGTCAPNGGWGTIVQGINVKFE